MRYRFLGPALSGIAPLCSLAAFAQAPAVPLSLSQSKLINLDTPYSPAVGAFAARADVRAFRGSEKQAYGTVEVKGAIQRGFGVLVRSSFSKFSDFNTSDFTIRHGGSDVEAMLSYTPTALPGLFIAAGGAYPNTPAQHHLFGTAEAIYQFDVAQTVSLFVGAKGALRQHSNLGALCAGIDARLGQGFDLIGDFTGVVTGENTYSTSDGSLQRRSTYGVGLRFSPTIKQRGQLSIDAGITNAVGGTTGFSMTPALGSTVGFYAALTYRY